MKLKLCAVVFAVLFYCLLFVACADASDGSVYMLNASAVTHGSTVTFTDERGNMWVSCLEDGASEVNGMVILVLWDNATPADITDDVIMDWR